MAHRTLVLITALGALGATGAPTSIPGLTARAWFGYRIATSPDRIVVSAPLFTVAGVLEAGAVYLYPWAIERPGPPPAPQRILAPQPQLAGRFGASVALEEDTLVVGAPGKGCAYVFTPDARGRVAVAGGRSRWDLAGAAVLFERDRRGAWVGQAIHPALPPDLSPQERQRASTTAGVRLQGGRLLLTVREPTPGLGGRPCPGLRPPLSPGGPRCGPWRLSLTKRWPGVHTNVCTPDERGWHDLSS